MDAWMTALILMCLCVLFLVIWIKTCCRRDRPRDLPQDDVLYIRNPNYARQTVSWGRTRGVVFGVDTFLLAHPEPTSQAEYLMHMGNMVLHIEITTAISTPESVKFLIHTNANLQHNFDPESSVVRVHSDFDWLHNRLVRNEYYTGLHIPAAPPCSDFYAAILHLRRLEETVLVGDNNLEDEVRTQYKHAFEETVGAHEAFLKALADCSELRDDICFQKFLQNSHLDTTSLCSPSSCQTLVDPPPTYNESMHQVQPLVDPPPTYNESMHQVQPSVDPPQTDNESMHQVQPLVDAPSTDNESMHQVLPLVDPPPTDNESMHQVLIVDGQ